MSLKIELFKEEEPANLAWTKSPFNYIAQYVIDMRNLDDPEILDYSYIPISGDMDADMYYSECVQNALVDEFTQREMVKPGWKIEPGVYRVVFGVNCCSDKYWTDCGYEYDAWEEYDMISKYKFTDKEVEVCWNGFCNVEDITEFK